MRSLILKMLVPVALIFSFIAGCATTSPIEPAATSQSHFAGSVYPGKTVTLDSATQGEPSYRLYQQAATGFVPLKSVRSDVEEMADKHCQRQGKSMHGITETDGAPPYVFGNFPRVELIFECVPIADTGVTKYQKLQALKNLLDNGALTRSEFDAEKAKILALP